MSAHSQEGHSGLIYAILICSHGESICHDKALGQLSITSLPVPFTLALMNFQIWSSIHSHILILCHVSHTNMRYIANGSWIFLFFSSLVGKVRCFYFSREDREGKLWEKEPISGIDLCSGCWTVGMEGVLLKIIDWCCSVLDPLVPQSFFHRLV